jgi:hypothetical protein
VTHEDDEDRSAEGQAGEAGEGTSTEPTSREGEEPADASGSREIPIGTPGEPDAHRRAKRRAETSSDEAEGDPRDEAQGDPSADAVDPDD